MRRSLASLLLTLATVIGSCSSTRLRAETVSAVRLDDLLAKAASKGSSASLSGVSAEPFVWQNFVATSNIKWQLIRGRVGVRNGDLMVKAEASTPVILAPKDPAIDWSLY